MEYNNIADMHTHSAYSFDGNDSCMSLCTSAYEKGAKYIAVTDHCDIDGADMDENTLFANQIADLEGCKKQLDGRIEVLKGIEIGQGIYRKERVEALLKKFDFDFVLGSLHNLENMEDFYFLDYSQFDVYELLEKYFLGLLELTQWGEYDSLAHLTYPLRYIVAREKLDVDMTRFSDLTDAIFESIIKSKKALEINTSGLFMDMKDTLPNISFIKRFKELGGEYITIGSDSHYADKVCRGIDAGIEIAKKCGFEYITIFEKRQPKLLPIE